TFTGLKWTSALRSRMTRAASCIGAAPRSRGSWRQHSSNRCHFSIGFGFHPLLVSRHLRYRRDVLRFERSEEAVVAKAVPIERVLEQLADRRLKKGR
ncbi:MAG: hypothetical protein ABI726_06920, partial [bacterium]